MAFYGRRRVRRPPRLSRSAFGLARATAAAGGSHASTPCQRRICRPVVLLRDRVRSARRWSGQRRAPEGVTVAGCVLPETRPNAFRLVVAPEKKGAAGPKLPKGIKAGAVLELVARGETNLQPFANQKIEVTGKLTNSNRRLEVVDARPIGACDPAAQ